MLRRRRGRFRASHAIDPVSEFAGIDAIETKSLPRARHPPSVDQIGAGGTTPRHREDAIDCSHRRWVTIAHAVLQQPPTHRTSTHRYRRFSKFDGRFGIEHPGQPAENRDVIDDSVGESKQQWHDIAFGHVIQQRKHVTADTHPSEPRIGVHRIIERHESELMTEFDGLGTTNRDKWPAEGSRCHQRGEAVEPTSANQIQKDGLRDVVGRVAGRNVHWQHRVTRFTRPGFKIAGCVFGRHRRHSGIDADRPRLEPRPKSLGDASDESRLQFRSWSEAMVDMDRRDVEAGTNGEHEQGQ